MVAPVLVFAIGNESRGDDALGPLLLRELALWLNDNGLDENFELLEDFQLQIEHAMDMEGRQLVLFIDAGMDTPAPFSFYPIKASGEATLFSHALAPEALLKTYEQFYGAASPAAFVLCIKGTDFELGEPLSNPAAENFAAAAAFARLCLKKPEIHQWNGLIT